MGINEATLRGWLCKAGLPVEAASLVAETFGSRYLEIQAKYRGQGAGGRSKALAAIEIARKEIQEVESFLQSSFSDGPEAAKDLLQASHVAACLAFAGVAANVYGLAQDGDEFDHRFEQFLSTAGEFARNRRVAGFLPQTLRDAYAEQREQIVRAARAASSNKGFFSKLFG